MRHSRAYPPSCFHLFNILAVAGGSGSGRGSGTVRGDTDHMASPAGLSDLEDPGEWHDLLAMPALLESRPNLQSSPTWGRGHRTRLEQPTTLELLVRDGKRAREAAVRAEEQEQEEGRMAVERRCARHESLAVEAEAQRSSTVARELALQTAVIDKFNAETTQKQRLHKAASRMQAHVRGHQAASTLRVFGVVATVIQAGARGALSQTPAQTLLRILSSTLSPSLCTLLSLVPNAHRTSRGARHGGTTRDAACAQDAAARDGRRVVRAEALPGTVGAADLHGYPEPEPELRARARARA